MFKSIGQKGQTFCWSPIFYCLTSACISSSWMWSKAASQSPPSPAWTQPVCVTKLSSGMWTRLSPHTLLYLLLSHPFSPPCLTCGLRCIKNLGKLMRKSCWPREFHLHKLCEFLQSALLVPRELKSQKLAQIIKSSTVPYEGAVSQACLLGLRCPPC